MAKNEKIIPTPTQSNEDLIRIALKSNQPMLIRGKRGTGKSQTIKSVCKQEGYIVITRNLNGAESYEVVAGLPRQDGATFNYLIPLWWKDVERMVKDGKKVCIFLDEINHAMPEVLNGLHGVLDPERRIAGLEIPEVRIIAAGNKAEENETLTEMPLPLLDRFAIQIDDFKNDSAKAYLSAKYPDMRAIIDIVFATCKNANPRRVEKLLNCIAAGLTDKRQITALSDKNCADLIYDELEHGDYKFALVNESANKSKKLDLVMELRKLDATDFLDVVDQATKAR